MGVSENKGYLILGVLILRILLFRVLYQGSPSFGNHHLHPESPIPPPPPVKEHTSNKARAWGSYEYIDTVDDINPALP